MAKYTAKFMIPCSVLVRGKFDYSKGIFPEKACGRKIWGYGESEISQKAAENAAEYNAQGRLAGHMRSAHKQ